jgi:hypothetical protein
MQAHNQFKSMEDNKNDPKFKALARQLIAGLPDGIFSNQKSKVG